MLFVLGGLYQRLIVWPTVRIAPRRRVVVVSRYMRGMSRIIFWLLRLAGARIRRSGLIPTAEPVLILMNHQSLLDIPTVILLGSPHVPAFVTRRRYARGIPAVSLCMRLLGCPVVDPERDPIRALRAIQRGAREETHGLLIFPEGHRSRDGEIDAFQTAGAEAALRVRRMPVYLVVTDGFWLCRTLADFAWKVPRLRGETEVLGPFPPPSSPKDDRAFLLELRERMVAHLRSLREARRSGPSAR
jgi:1-acyl-sn-glycerol-3-phosphate acyltransferase